MLEEIIEDTVTSFGFTLINLIERGDVRNKVIEVFIDREEMFSVDEIAQISRAISEKLEDTEYRSKLSKLIVSSPGADKPIKHPWQLAKHLGKDAQIILNSDENLTGRLLRVQNDSITLQISDKKIQLEREISWPEVKEAKIKLKF